MCMNLRFQRLCSLDRLPPQGSAAILDKLLALTFFSQPHSHKPGRIRSYYSAQHTCLHVLAPVWKLSLLSRTGVGSGVIAEPGMKIWVTEGVYGWNEKYSWIRSSGNETGVLCCGWHAVRHRAWERWRRVFVWIRSVMLFSPVIRLTTIWQWFWEGLRCY